MLVHSERGNLYLESRDGAAILWVIEEEHVILKTCYFPGDYPAWSVAVDLQEPLARVVESINANLQGWYVRKCNVTGINIDADGTVCQPFEGE